MRSELRIKMSNILPMLLGHRALVNTMMNGLREKGQLRSLPAPLYPMTTRMFARFPDAVEEKKKEDKYVSKTYKAPTVALLENDKVMMMSMDAAKMIAKRRSMSLVQVHEVDRRFTKPLYK